jgi:hypothetical protein
MHMKTTFKMYAIQSRHNSIFSLSLVGICFALFLAGCSGGGTRLVRGQICPDKYSPFPVNEKSASYKKTYRNKLEIKPDVPFRPNPAYYTYTGSEIYYNDSKLDLRIHLKHSIDKDGKETLSTVCASSFSALRRGEKIEVSMPILSDVFVDSDFITRVKSTTINITINNKPGEIPLKYVIAHKDTDYTPGHPADFYSEFDSRSQYFMSLKKTTNYRLISHLKKSVASDNPNDVYKDIIVRANVKLKIKE